MALSRLEKFQRQLEADPASPAFVDFAAELLEQGQVRRALEVCTAGLAHHPDLVEARILCGRAFLRIGQAGEARTHFESILASHPRDAGVHAAIGEALLERGLQRSAIQLINKGLSLAPGDARLEALLAAAEGRSPAAAPPTGRTVPGAATPPPQHAVPGSAMPPTLQGPRGPVNPAAPGEGTGLALPPPIQRDGPPPLAGAAGNGNDLLADLPAPPRDEPEPPPPEPSIVAEEAASVAAAYERELRERLAAEQAMPPSWLRRHRLGITCGLLLAIGGGAAFAAYEYRRAATHADDVARYTAAARNGVLRDTLAAYRASLTALDEVLDRDGSHASARALKAQVLATLAARWGTGAADAAAAAALLGSAEAAAEPEAVLATRLLLATPDERAAIEEEILAVDPAAAGATVHSLAGAILLARGESAAAVERFNAAIGAVPGHVPTLIHVADHYRERNESSEALRYDRLALAVVEDHPLALLGSAEAQLALAKDAAPLEEALAGLSKIGADAVPVAERERYVQIKARLLASLGRREEALALLEPLRAAARDDLELLPALSNAFVAVGAADRAEELFRADTIRASSPLAVREAWARALLARERFRAVTAVPRKAGERNLHLLEGIARLHLGERNAARTALRATATRQAGKMPADAVVFLALADLHDGRLDKARRNLERLGTGRRARTAGRWAWAELLVREGRLEEAHGVLREAVELDRDSVEARCALGRLLLRMGDGEGARLALGEALARNPFHGEARTALGAAALASGDLAAARQALAASIEQSPDDLEALAFLARVEAAEGKPDEARRRLAQAVRRKPRAAAVLLARAALAKIDGDAKAEITHLEQAAKSDPSDPRIFRRLGELRLAMGAAAPARVAFSRALGLHPASPETQHGHAQALIALGQAPATQKRLAAEISRLPDDAAPALRASLLVALGAVEQALARSGARAHAEQAVALAPESPAANLALGEILAALGDAAGAEKYLRTALGLDPQAPAILRALGLHLLGKGERREAEELLARYLRLAPDGPASRTVQASLEK